LGKDGSLRIPEKKKGKKKLMGWGVKARGAQGEGEMGKKKRVLPLKKRRERFGSRRGSDSREGRGRGGGGFLVVQLSRKREKKHQTLWWEDCFRGRRCENKKLPSLLEEEKDWGGKLGEITLV